jgi:hypothetical protein
LIEELAYVFGFSPSIETFVAFKKHLIGLAKSDEGKSHGTILFCVTILRDMRPENVQPLALPTVFRTAKI